MLYRAPVFLVALMLLLCAGCGDEQVSAQVAADAGDNGALEQGAGLDAEAAPGDIAEATPGGEPADEPSETTYVGGWPVGACAQEPLQGTGTKVGDIAHDFQQPDQFGDMFRLHDFCDRVILLVGSAYW